MKTDSVWLVISLVNVSLGMASFAAVSESRLVAAEPTVGWSFDSKASSMNVEPNVGTLRGTVRGNVRHGPGVQGSSLVFDGAESIVEIEDSAELTCEPDGFTVTAWVNAYGLDGSQQMILAKNRYSLNERQWGMMIDKDNCFRLYVHQGKWATTTSTIKPMPGHWYQIAVTATNESFRLFINGMEAGSIELTRPVPKTAAPLTIGGVNDNGRIWQTWWGAIDEVKVLNEPLPAATIASNYKPVTATHKAGGLRGNRFELWNTNIAIPGTKDLLPLSDVEFHVIKRRTPEQDGYNWLHGVALAWHKGKLYSSFGHNVGAENTATEEANGCISEDGGKTWGPLFQIDAGDKPDLAISHGVFLSHEGELWAFHGAFTGRMKNVHTRAYVLDEQTDNWQRKGTVAGDGFWAMHPPQRMDDGDWIMAGVAPSDGYGGPNDPAAVAISHGDDFTSWEVIKIPKPATMEMWGEACVFVDSTELLCISRYRRPIALVSTSGDFGKTWTTMRESNLPMAASQPFTGTLSSGQRYLICTTTADSGNRRSPLTIAVSEPDDKRFSRVYRIRDAVHDGPGESGATVGLAYPYAIEHAGKLYVGYSNNGGRGGNRNSAELAIIPIESLQTK